MDEKVWLWKLFDHSYVQSSLPQIMRHIDNGISEALYSWKFYGNESRCSSFLVMHYEININEGVRKIYQLHKNPSLYFEEQCTKLRSWHFTYYCMFLFRSSKLSFQIQSSVDLIIFPAFCLLFYLPIFCVFWSSSSATTLCLWRISKMLLRLNALFLKV